MPKREVFQRDTDFLKEKAKMVRKETLRLTDICCKIRVGRDVSLDESLWAMKLIEVNKHAAGIAERLKS